LSSGKIFIDMSTVSPTYSRKVASEVAKTGTRMLYAPLSVSAITVEVCKLLTIVGGDKEIFGQARPILLDIEFTITYMGPNGTMATMKLALNRGLRVCDPPRA
jgi:3-hydroxyisobutyrate dehydrogenase-like beta-hydroxyacid dehydrogenase